MPHPLQSAYNGIFIDDGMSLVQGVQVVSTTLVNALNIGDDECLLTDASGAQGRGTMIVDDEIIYYGSRLGNVPSTLESLQRGVDGGSPEADHTAGAAVSLVSAPRFGNPAFLDAILTMQSHLVELRAAKKYVALMTQLMTNDPSPLVLENTIGEILWSRVDIGYYVGTLGGVFTDEKTVCFMGSWSFGLGTNPTLSYLFSLERVDDDNVAIQCQYQDGLSRDSGVIDGILLRTPVEIRVYPS